MLKRITISNTCITIRDIPTNDASLILGNEIETQVVMEQDKLVGIEITLTLDQARELAIALGAEEVEVTE